MRITLEHVAGAAFALVGIGAFDSPVVGAVFTITGCVAWAVVVVAMQVAKEMR